MSDLMTMVDDAATAGCIVAAAPTIAGPDAQPGLAPC